MNGKTRYIGSGTATTVSGGNVLESEAFAGQILNVYPSINS